MVSRPHTSSVCRTRHSLKEFETKLRRTATYVFERVCSGVYHQFLAKIWQDKTVDWKKWGILIVLLLTIWVWQEWPDGRLHVVFCDVGQGDGALIVLGAFQAVVDTGADKNKILSCLSRQMPFWDRQIELVFISHSDKDHSGALEEIKLRYKVGRVVDKPKKNDVIRYGMLAFDIIKGSELADGVVEVSGSETNNRSVVMRVVYGNFSALFTGDIDTESELALVSMGVLKKSKVIKVSHHGSKFGSTAEFLQSLRPELAIISVGEKNSYGHPNGDTLIRLDAVGAKTLRTDVRGMISLITDGKTTEIFCEK